MTFTSFITRNRSFNQTIYNNTGNIIEVIKELTSYASNMYRNI